MKISTHNGLGVWLESRPVDPPAPLSLTSKDPNGGRVELMEVDKGGWEVVVERPHRVSVGGGQASLRGGLETIPNQDRDYRLCVRKDHFDDSTQDLRVEVHTSESDRALVVDYILAAELGARHINLQGWRPCEHVSRVSVEGTVDEPPSEPMVEATRVAVPDVEVANVSETKDAEVKVETSDGPTPTVLPVDTADPIMPMIDDEESPVYGPPPVVSDTYVPIKTSDDSELPGREDAVGPPQPAMTEKGEEPLTEDTKQLLASLLREADLQEGKMPRMEEDMGGGRGEQENPQGLVLPAGPLLEAPSQKGDLHPTCSLNCMMDHGPLVVQPPIRLIPKHIPTWNACCLKVSIYRGQVIEIPDGPPPDLPPYESDFSCLDLQALVGVLDCPEPQETLVYQGLSQAPIIAEAVDCSSSIRTDSFGGSEQATRLSGQWIGDDKDGSPWVRFEYNCGYRSNLEKVSVDNPQVVTEEMIESARLQLPEWEAKAQREHEETARQERKRLRRLKQIEDGIFQQQIERVKAEEQELRAKEEETRVKEAAARDRKNLAAREARQRKKLESGVCEAERGSTPGKKVGVPVCSGPTLVLRPDKHGAWPPEHTRGGVRSSEIRSRFDRVKLQDSRPRPNLKQGHEAANSNTTSRPYKPSKLSVSSTGVIVPDSDEELAPPTPPSKRPRHDNRPQPAFGRQDDDTRDYEHDRRHKSRPGEDGHHRDDRSIPRILTDPRDLPRNRGSTSHHPGHIPSRASNTKPQPNYKLPEPGRPRIAAAHSGLRRTDTPEHYGLQGRTRAREIIPEEDESPMQDQERAYAEREKEREALRKKVERKEAERRLRIQNGYRVDHHDQRLGESSRSGEKRARGNEYQIQDQVQDRRPKGRDIGGSRVEGSRQQSSERGAEVKRHRVGHAHDGHEQQPQQQTHHRDHQQDGRPSEGSHPRRPGTTTTTSRSKPRDIIDLSRLSDSE